jgi:hypothetical protein
MRYLRLGADCTSASNPPAFASPAGAWQGQVGEMILYNAELSAGDVTLVETYLKNKWGTP